MSGKEETGRLGFNISHQGPEAAETNFVLRYGFGEKDMLAERWLSRDAEQLAKIRPGHILQFIGTRACEVW